MRYTAIHVVGMQRKIFWLVAQLAITTLYRYRIKSFPCVNNMRKNPLLLYGYTFIS